MSFARFVNPRLHFLLRDNHKAPQLALLRVITCLWLLKEVIINWSSMELLYGNSSFAPAAALLNQYHEGARAWVNNHYTIIMILYLVIIVAQLFGIGKWFTAFLLFLAVSFVHQMSPTFHDGGYKMIRLVLLYLSFADSYRYFSLRTTQPVSQQPSLINLVSNLAAFTIMLQLCAAYFSSGLIKWNDITWREGDAVYYILQYDRFMGTDFNRQLASQSWLMIGVNYYVLLLELLFPLLVWVKKFRPFVLIAGFLLHAGIYIFMMIYSFQVVFVAIYILFIPAGRWTYWFDKVTPKLLR